MDSPNVLIIEDQDPSRLFLVYEIKKPFPRAIVYQAVTLESAEKILKEKTIDIVLIDPGLPGYDATDRMQRLSVVKKIISLAQHAIPIVFTGFDDLYEARQCIGLGAKGYLAKTGFGVGVIQKVLQEIDEAGCSVQLSEITHDIPELFLVLTDREQEIIDRIRTRKRGTNRSDVYELMAKEYRIDPDSVREYHKKGRDKLRKSGLLPEND